MLSRIVGLLSRFYRWVRYSRFNVIAKLLLVVMPLLFLLNNLLSSWQNMAELEVQFDVARLSLATVFLMGVFALLPVSTRIVLSAFGVGISYSSAYRAYFLSQLAKYLPGGIWILPGRVVALNSYGVSAVTSSTGAMIELAVLLLSGALVFAIFLSFKFSSGLYILIGVFLLLVISVILVSKLDSILSMVSKHWINDLSLEISLPKFFTLLIVDLVFWLLVGLGFYILVGAVQPVSMKLILPFAGAFSAAWVAGFLAFVTPGGLGVREGVLAILLASLLPAPLPAVLALLARLWWTGAELLSVLLAWIAVKLISTDLKHGELPISNH